jgi:hypothetical protein
LVLSNGKLYRDPVTGEAIFENLNHYDGDFKSVEVGNDTLVILANKNHASPDSMGGWKIDRLIGDYTLGLYDEYYTMPKRGFVP